MRKSGRFWFAVGFLAVILLLVPGWILGGQAVIAYHDQLDGEMIAYLLQAKHLGDGEVLPEFMGGAPKTALTPPAPGCVLLFVGGHGLPAFFAMQLLGCVTGYVGMYLLGREVTGRELPSVLAAGLYAALPFLPVYGLSQYGLPLLLWCVLQLRKGRRRWFAFGYAAFFAFNSSLVLAGFAVLAVFAVGLAGEALRMWRRKRLEVRGNGVPQAKEQRTGMQREDRQGIIASGGMWLVLCVIYLLTNLSLCGQVLGMGESATSHKAEYALAAEGFLRGWSEGFLYGGQHSQDYHLYLSAAVALTLVWTVLRRLTTQSGKKAIGKNVSGREAVGRESVGEESVGEEEIGEEAAGKESVGQGWRGEQSAVLARVILYALCCNVVLAGIAAGWNSGVGVAFRKHLGALGAFQLDRVLWLSPCLWYLILACGITLILETWREEGRAARLQACICCVLTAAAVGVTGLLILKNSDFKSNVQKLRNPDYPVMSYADYYAVGVMDQVEEFLYQTTGLEQSAYRVVSLGIDPAAALYHGFYCLDGYSNNYPLEYKHRFREVIAPALEVSDYLRAYYDEWGNRCYLFGSECPGYYTIQKNGFYFSHLELDVEALRELGGNYLFSAAYIANAEELGLELLREEPFRTEESYYSIYLYEVEAP